MEQNNSTQGIENISRSAGFTSVKNVKGESTVDNVGATPAPNGGDMYGIGHVPKVVAMLEDRFAFTSVLVGIIGDIIIASFGHLENFSDYLRYSVFLVVMFVLYKFLHLGRIELRQMDKINKITLASSIFLIAFIIVEHFDKVTAAFKSFMR